ncbi:MAG: hypothetical protein H6Q00_837 [Holophagaceae bacterium]|nr:hypothetical protein [Holophagaceae bacterium]
MTGITTLQNFSSVEVFVLSRLKRLLTTTPSGRLLLMPHRAWLAIRSCSQPFFQIPRWLFSSREITSFTYTYEEMGAIEACHLVANITQTPFARVNSYRHEFMKDTELKEIVQARTANSAHRWTSDGDLRQGRHLLNYLLVRTMKPRTIVEAGVLKGLGALVSCRALSRNAAEGSQGHYFGVDIHEPERAFLFGPPEAARGELVHMDIAPFLRQSEEPIDLYIHDTIPADDHVQEIISALRPRLATGSIVMASWTTLLLLNSFEEVAQIFSFSEKLSNHWYRGRSIFLAKLQNRDYTPPQHCPLENHTTCNAIKSH